MSKKSASRASWERHKRKNGSFYFVYDHRNPRTLPLLDSGKYGVVQLICVEYTAHNAFKAGFAAGRRSARSAGAVP